MNMNKMKMNVEMISEVNEERMNSIRGDGAKKRVYHLMFAVLGSQGGAIRITKAPEKERQDEETEGEKRKTLYSQL